MVELAVTAAVEPVLGALPGGARDRGGAGLQRERGLGAEALVAGGVADQDRGGQWPAALFGQQLGAASGDELAELARQRVDLAVELTQLAELLARDPGGMLRSWRSTRSSVRALFSAPRLSEASSSPQSSSRCQRSRFTVRVRSATRSQR